MQVGKILMMVVVGLALAMPVLAEDYVPNEVLVKWKDQAELPDEISTVRVSDVATAVELFAQDERVDYVEPNYKRYLAVTPNDTYYEERQWYLEQTSDHDLDMATAWEQTTGSADIVVAVIDTGIDLNHPDLVDNLWTNPGEIAGNGVDDDSNGYVDDINGWDFIGNDNNPSAQPTTGSFVTDDVIHGTHVAGTIGASGNNSIGVTGINWDVSIMVLKIFDDDGSGSTSDIASAVNYAIANGADVINMSYGGSDSTQTEESVMTAAVDAGIVLVAAAGNSSRNLNNTPYYPACYDNVIGVGATNSNDAITSFSNFGTNCVDLAAPGQAIFNTYYYDDAGTYPTLQDGFGGYGSMSGTSMATPMVSGVAALVLAENPSLTITEVHDVLTSTVDVIDDERLGAGRLNAGSAVAAALNYAAPDSVVISSYHASDREIAIASEERVRDVQPYFQWDTPNSLNAIVGYYVYFGRERLDPVTYGNLQTGLTYAPTLPTDSADHTYRLRVKVLDNTGLTSDLSQFLYSLDRKVSRPTWQSVTEQPDGSVLLRWYRPSGEHVQAYKVYRSTERNGRYRSLSGRTTLRRFTDTTVRPGKRYYYKVRAIDDLGNISTMSPRKTIKL